MAKKRVAAAPPTEQAPPGLKALELKRLKTLYRTAVRDAIKRLPVPAAASMADMITVFDAVVDEVMIGRAIVKALAGRATPGAAA